MRLRDAAPLAVPVAVSAILLLAYNEFLFGKPVPDTRVPELGDRYPFYWPWAGAAQFTRFVTNAFGMLFDRQMGLLPYAPVYLLAAVGVIAIVAYGRKADRRLLAAMTLIAAPYVTTIAAFEFWHGIWCPPARYLTTLVPLAAAPLAVALAMLDRSLLFCGVYAMLCAAGNFFMLIIMSDALMMWPNYPLFLWLRYAPESPVHVDLWSRLPAFPPPDNPLLPSASGRAIGLAFLVVALSSLPLLRRPRFTAKGRRPILVHSLLVGTALLALASGWYVMSYPYWQPGMDMRQQARGGPTQ